MRAVIIGAGQAGAWAARTLREHAPAADIVLVGAEPHPPYERPPLSKGVLLGTESEPPWLLPQAQADALGIRLMLNRTAIAIDRAARQVHLAGGGHLAYDRLVLATGGRARMPGIPGEDLPGVHTLRSMADARRLRGELLPGRRLLVVGGGWIGLEAAASARRLGVEVVVIERGSRLCARSVPPDISAFLLRLHRRHAVDVQVQGAVDRLERSAHGETLLAHTHRGIEAFDLVLIGIGLEPSVELAVSCGLHVDDGIVVDASGRTSDPCIFAAGDVANQPCARNDAAIPARIRLESWANAQNHGIAVGRAVAGLDPLPGDLPWFWSDQYDVNMQVLGMATDVGAWVLRGSFEDAGFCLFQLADGRLQAAIAVNRARELKLAKRLAKAGKRLDPERLRDPGVRLESM